MKDSTGTPSTVTPALTSDLPGASFEAAVSITTGAIAGEGGTGSDAGSNTVAMGVASLVEMGNSDTGPLVFIDGPTDSRFFYPSGTGAYTFIEQYGGNDSLNATADAGGGHDFQMRSVDGTQWSFKGFDVSDAAIYGKPIQEVSPGGVVTSFSYNASSGHLANVSSSYNSGSTTVSERYDYAYTNGGIGDTTADTRISSIELNRQVSAGTFTPVQSLVFSYYTSPTLTGGGKDGDLKFASLVDGSPSGTVVETDYYRYAQVSIGVAVGVNGSANAVEVVPNQSDSSTLDLQDVLAYAFDASSYARLMSATTATDPAVITSTALLDTYASVKNVYETAVDAGTSQTYYTGRLSQRIVQGEGCSACSGGLGVYSYSYTVNPDMVGSADMNKWSFETTITKPDSSSEYMYFNGYHQPMLDIVQNLGLTPGGQTSSYQATYTQYDAAGSAILTASPSAVILPSIGTGADPWSTLDAHDDLMDWTGSAHLFLAPHTGSITTTSYTTATNVQGELVADSYAHEGESGTAIHTEHWNYSSYSADTTVSFAIPTVTADTTYGDASGSDARTTSFNYSGGYYSGTYQLKSLFTTLQSIGSGQNGTSAPQVETDYYDPYGRTVWSVDPAGYLSFTAYDPATGAVVKSVEDADTSTYTNPFVSTPSRAGSGSPLDLETDYLVDDQGRVTKAISPAGRVTYTVYRDAYSVINADSTVTQVRNEVRTYTGWTGSSDTGPIQVSRDIWPAPGSNRSSYSESLNINVAPAVSGSAPTGLDSFTTSDVSGLTRQIANAAGQVVESDVYFSLAGQTYNVSAAQIGLAGNDSGSTSANSFYATEYAYDHLGRQWKTTDPTGTIAIHVMDSEGNTLSKWVGTSTNVSSGYWAANNTTGSTMTDVEDNVYDQTLSPATPGLSLTADATNTGSAVTCYVVLTYAYASGQAETVASPETSLSVTTGNRLYITAPLAVAGASGYNVYVSASPGMEQLQNGSIVSFASGWTLTGSPSTSGSMAQRNGVGDNNLTQSTLHPGGGAVDRVMQTLYNWMDEAVAAKGGVASSLSSETTTSGSASQVHRPIVYSAIDNVGETFASYQYDGDGVALTDFESLALQPQPSDANLIPTGVDIARLQSMVSADYDAQGRVYRSAVYSVSNPTDSLPSLPTIDSSTRLFTNKFYDPRGNLIETAAPGGVVTKSQFNGAGWDTLDSVSDGGAVNNASTVYLSPTYAGTNNYDVVLSQTVHGYDLDGMETLTTSRQRYDNDPSSSLGNLNGPSGGTLASRDSYAGSYYDAAGRAVAAVDAGTNNGSAYTLPSAYNASGGTDGSSPTVVSTGLSSVLSGDIVMLLTGTGAGERGTVANFSSGTITLSSATWAEAPDSTTTFAILDPTPLVGQTTYTKGGYVSRTIDPKNLSTSFAYDLTGAVTFQVADDSAWGPLDSSSLPTPTNGTNQTTGWSYDGAGHTLTMAAYMPSGTPNQTTVYVYGVSPATGSTLYSNDLLARTEYPDATTGQAGSWVFYDPTGGGDPCGVAGNNTYLNYQNNNAPDASQVAWLGNDSAVSQTITMTGGQYSVSFDATSAVNFGGAHPFYVLVDGVSVGLYSLSGAAYSAETTATFTVAAGRHTIAFQSVSHDGKVALIDAVTINAVGSGAQAVAVNDASFESPPSPTGYYSYPTDPANDVPTQEQKAAFDNLGEPITYADQNGTTHTYSRDVLGRTTADVVTTLGTGVDGAVRALGYAFNGRGLPLAQSSYDSTSMMTVVNQVQEGYNGFGQATIQYQAHSGNVSTGSTPNVQYGYTNASGGVNNSRPVSETYPNGRVINYTYSSGIDTTISRITGMADAAGTGAGSLVGYAYLGLGEIVSEAGGNGVTQSYVTGTGATRYGGLDQFDRVKEQKYTTSTSTVEDLVYGYDADGNVMTRTDDTSAASANNTDGYAYDSMNRLTGWKLGNASTGFTSTVNSQSWGLDAVGNWNSQTTGGTAVSRINNAKNEIASQSGNGMTYDNVGNLLKDGLYGPAAGGDETRYDAWNRMVYSGRYDGSGAPASGQSYGYAYTADGRDASQTNACGGSESNSYYDLAWRVVETDSTPPSYGSGSSGGSSTPYLASQYVWGLTYVNDLVEKDDTNGPSGTNYGTSGSGLTRRLYAVRDANHDVTAVTNASGAAVERFDYTPYGTRTTMTDSYVAGSDDATWNVGFQGGVYLPTSTYSASSAGLIQFDNRVYSITLGRWLQPDPAGYVDGASEYGFVTESPINYTDPLGLTIRSSDDLGPYLKALHFNITVVEADPAQIPGFVFGFHHNYTNFKAPKGDYASLQGEIITEMANSKSTFRFHSANELKKNIDARLETIKVMKNWHVCFGENNLAGNKNENRFFQDNEGAIKPGVKLSDAIADILANPGNYQCACETTVEVAMLAGIMKVDPNSVNQYNNLREAFRGLTFDRDSDDTSSIPGESSYVQAGGPVSSIIYLGENVINIGNGLLGSSNGANTVEEWVRIVTKFSNAKAEYPGKRQFPGIGVI